MAGPVKLSKALTSEISGCESLDDFRTLMEHKGLWLNENAAKDLYRKLHKTSKEKQTEHAAKVIFGKVKK